MRQRHQDRVQLQKHKHFHSLQGFFSPKQIAIDIYRNRKISSLSYTSDKPSPIVLIVL